jgi:hypothetical protein
MTSRASSEVESIPRDSASISFQVEKEPLSIVDLLIYGLDIVGFGAILRFVIPEIGKWIDQLGS